VKHFRVLLSNAQNASLSDYEATVSIADNDDVPSIQWNVLTQSVTENVGTVVVRAELSAVSGKTVTASLASSGTANSSDHNFTATTLTILPGLAYKDLEFQVNNDNLTAAVKTLILTMSAPGNANLGANALHTVNIIDDDGNPILFVGNATVAESAGSVSIPVSLGSGLESGESVSFTWAVSSGSATTPADFSATTGVVNITGPASVANLTVNIADDSLYEGPEGFSISVSGASGAATIQAGADTGYITITDNEAQPDVSFNSANQVASENAGSALVGLTLSQAVGSNVVIPYTVSGSASYGASGSADHELDGGVITIPAGSTTANLVIPITNDTLNESSETVVVTLQTPSGGAILGSTKIFTLTINDNDSTPSVSIANASATEGANVSFSVSLSSGSGQTVTVDYALANGSATSPADYNPSSLTGTVTFYPGETTKYIAVPTVDNATADGSRTFGVTISNPTQATLGTSTATGTINDNEGPLTISINDSGATEGQNVTFTVSLSAPASSSVTVDYATSDGDNGDTSLNAAAPGDYTAKTGTLNIPAGQTSGTIVVSTANDSSYEANEKFKLTLSNPSTGSLSDALGLGTVQNDDTAPMIEFALASSAIAEDAGTHQVTVTLGEVQAVPVTVNFGLTGTATGTGTDYSSSTSSPISFAAGETSKTISFTINDDSAVESSETIIITLSGPSGASAVLGSKSVHTVTITDNDNPPTVTSMSPSTGNVTSIPTTVTVTFSRAMSTGSVQNTANWSLICQSGTVSIQSVSLSSNVATVTLNPTVQPSAGDTCTLEATVNLLDSASNALSGSLASRQAVYTKVNPATVTNVTSSKADGYYKMGETINISVTFSEVVTVTGGIPQITLETGTSDAVIDLTIGSGTTTLQGTYTVGASDTSSDLNYASTSALVANGAQIKNASNVEATLTLPGLASAGSLATNKAIVIDTTAPTAPSSVDDLTWKNSTSVSPAITFSGSSDGGSGIDHHEAQVVLGSNTSTVLASWQTFTTGSTISGLALTNGTQYKVQVRAVDRAGNISSEYTSDGWTVDTTAPSVPTSVTLGSVPSNATDTPMITYTAGTDGGSGIASHQVKIIKTSDSSVAKDWTTHTSGTAITGISPALEDGVQYSVLVRSVDNAGKREFGYDSGELECKCRCV
jgi:hypothetical protein